MQESRARVTSLEAHHVKLTSEQPRDDWRQLQAQQQRRQEDLREQLTAKSLEVDNLAARLESVTQEASVRALGSTPSPAAALGSTPVGSGGANRRRVAVLTVMYRDLLDHTRALRQRMGELEGQSFDLLSISDGDGADGPDLGPPSHFLDDSMSRQDAFERLVTPRNSMRSAGASGNPAPF